MKFELDTLDSYDEESLIQEIKRVADRLGGATLTIARFDELAKVNSTTIRKRFGSWTNALDAAGLSDRASALATSIDSGKNLDKAGLALLAQRIAKEKSVNSLSMKEFSESSGIGQKAILSRAESWGHVLSEAGLEPVALGRRYSDLDCFENILLLWTHYGRQPKYGELKIQPSKVGPKAYIRRWGSWRKSLKAFIEHMEASSVEENDFEIEVSASADNHPITREQKDPPRSRHIPLRIRYKILKRDSFRCVTCGRSPATSVGLELHIDHIEPWSKGGSNDEHNLRTLCSDCNLGKGDQHESA